LAIDSRRSKVGLGFLKTGISNDGFTRYPVHLSGKQDVLPYLLPKVQEVLAVNKQELK
jgi:hypothetical protein